MGNVLKVENVSKKFGKKTVIDNVSFEVNEGEIVGYLGPNGAGKTTVIKMIMGLLRITKGKIKILDIDVTKDYEKAAMQFGGIIENPEMYGNLTAVQNLKIFSDYYKGITKNRLNEVIELVGLKGRENEKIKKYSLGMKQRLGLAQAIIHRPKLLILDEPTNGLDPVGIKDLRDILRKLVQSGSSVLVSSHLLSEMELMCDKIIIIDHGKIIDSKDLRIAKEEIERDNVTGQEVKHYEYDTNNNGRVLEILNSKNIEAQILNNKVEVKATKEKIAELDRKSVV